MRACWNLWLRPWWWSWRCCCLICKSWVWKERWFIQLPGHFFSFLSLGLFCNSFSVRKIVCGSFWLTSSWFVFLLPTFFILINCVWFLRKFEEQELKHVLRIALFGCFVFIKIEKKNWFNLAKRVALGSVVLWLIYYEIFGYPLFFFIFIFHLFGREHTLFGWCFL